MRDPWDKAHASVPTTCVSGDHPKSVFKSPSLYSTRALYSLYDSYSFHSYSSLYFRTYSRYYSLFS